MIKKEQVDSLLKLADRYQVDEVSNEVEVFLNNTDQFNKMEKLLKADIYNLMELKVRYISFCGIVF